MSDPEDKVDRDFYGENAEHFDATTLMDDFIQDIGQRVTTFNNQFKLILKGGYYFRKIHSIVSKKTLVEDTRTGKVSELFMLGSNSYLDLAIEPSVKKRTLEAIDKYGVGCGGPAVLNGYTVIHRELELKLAAMKNCQDAILFSSGYAANLGWATGLLNKDDFLVYDMQSHGSLFDAMRMGDFTSSAFLHNDVNSLEKKLSKIRSQHDKSNIIVCVEGVYSMDGDLSPLAEIEKVCRKYRALLSIDDAHGTGVTGKLGHGTHEHFGLQGKVDIVMGTFSKSLTATGGFVASNTDLINFLRIYGNSYIYSATLAPSIVGTVLGCLEFMEKHPSRIDDLRSNTQYFVEGINKLGLSVKSESAIIPIFIPKDISMRELVYKFHQEGIFVNGIEYPSVPRNRQRLRISMMATYTKNELDQILKIFEKVFREFKLIK